MKRGETSQVFLGVDPDSTHSALAIVCARGVVSVSGGGSRKDGEPLCRAESVLKLLKGYRGARCAVERQTRGPWSESCEGVALVHGAWKACCELARVPYTGVLPVQWIRHWLDLAPLTGPPRGSEKPYYTAAKARCPDLVSNEDQAAALGIAVWLAHLHGVSVPLVKVGRDKIRHVYQIKQEQPAQVQATDRNEGRRNHHADGHVGLRAEGDGPRGEVAPLLPAAPKPHPRADLQITGKPWRK